MNSHIFPGEVVVWHLCAFGMAASFASHNECNACAERRAGIRTCALGYHLEMIGEYAGAKPYYERALAIRKKVLEGKCLNRSHKL